MKVIIMRGIPGSGKSTYIQHNYSDAKVVSADHYFMKLGNGEYKFDSRQLTKAHTECFREFLSYLTNKESLVIVDNTNTTAVEIAPYVALAQAMGYNYEIHLMKCDPAIAFARNIHGVPLKGIEQMAFRLEQNKLPPFWNKQNVWSVKENLE